MLAWNCIVVSELCNGMLYIFSLNQPTCSSSLLPSVIVDLKTGRKERKGYKIQAHWFGPRSAQIPGCLQGSTAAVLYPSTQGKFTALQRALLSLTFLLLASLTPSCTWPFLLSVPDHSSVPITTAKQLQVEFSLHKQPVTSLMLNTYEIVTMCKGNREGRTKRSFWLHFAEKLLEVNTQDEAQEVATQKWSGLGWLYEQQKSCSCLWQ